MTTRFTPSRGLRHTAAAVLVAVGGTVALSAWAMGEHGPAGGMGGGMHAMHGGGMGMPGMMLGGRMLDGIDATEAQRTQIQQIMQAAMGDMRQQHEARRALAERAAAVFAAPTVDANAAEQVRQQMLAQHDATSKRMMAAMIEASRVLTPEQRARLAERVKERAAKMQQRHERMRGEAAPRS